MLAKPGLRRTDECFNPTHAAAELLRQSRSRVTERFLLGADDVPQKVQHEVEAAVSEEHDVVSLQIGL